MGSFVHRDWSTPQGMPPTNGRSERKYGELGLPNIGHPAVTVHEAGSPESDILASVAQTRDRTNSYVYFAFRLNIVRGEKIFLKLALYGVGLLQKIIGQQKEKVKSKSRF